MTERRQRAWLLTGLKVLASALLVGFVLSRLSLDEIRLAMAEPRWGWLSAALAVYGISALAGAQQWIMILRAGGLQVPSGQLRRLYFVGLFFNNFLPANIGGDAYKIIDLGRREDRASGVFCATLLDRLVGLGALTALAVLVLTIASVGGIPLPSSVLWLIPALVALFGGLVVLLSRRLGTGFVGLLEAVGLAVLAVRIRPVIAELRVYRGQVNRLNGIFVFSMGVQLLRLGTHLLVAVGLGYHLSSTQMVQLLVLIPMLAISLTLPVTINGIGLRESVSAELLVGAGLAAPHAVAMEVAAYLVQVVFSLPGGVLFWLGRGNRRSSGN